MNRQARLAGTDYPWHDYGAVTFEEAAKRYAFGGWHGTLEVRDESEPEIIHTLTVEHVTEYRVTNLRGGE
jgi:hypothetical protein